MPRSTPRAAVVVDDLEALDHRIAAFVDEYTYAGETQRTMRKAWASWKNHCSAMDVNEFEAPVEVFEALLVAQRRDGRRYSTSHLANVMSAVRSRYADRHLVPAVDRPANRSSWQELTRGSRNQLSRLRAQGEVVTIDHQPLTRELMTRMLVRGELPRSEDPASTYQVDAVCAASLLALDFPLSRPAISHLRRSDVSELDGGAVRVLDHVFECDHDERQRGVPWDCTACSLLTVLEAHDGQSVHRVCPGFG